MECEKLVIVKCLCTWVRCIEERFWEELSECLNFEPSKRIIAIGKLNDQVGVTVEADVVGKFGVPGVNYT